MVHWGSLIIGIVLGSFITIGVMSILIAGSRADDMMGDEQYK